MPRCRSRSRHKLGSDEERGWETSLAGQAVLYGTVVKASLAVFNFVLVCRAIFLLLGSHSSSQSIKVIYSNIILTLFIREFYIKQIKSWQTLEFKPRK